MLWSSSNTVDDDESRHGALLAGLTHSAGLCQLGEDTGCAQIINSSLEETGFQGKPIDLLCLELQLILGLSQPAKRTVYFQWLWAVWRRHKRVSDSTKSTDIYKSYKLYFWLVTIIFFNQALGMNQICLSMFKTAQYPIHVCMYLSMHVLHMLMGKAKSALTACWQDISM